MNGHEERELVAAAKQAADELTRFNNLLERLIVLLEKHNPMMG